MSRALTLPEWPEGPFRPDAGREVAFRAAFAVVNAIVYDLLDDHRLTRPAARDDTPGATHYRVWLEQSRVTLSLKVLNRGEKLTSLRLQAQASPAGWAASPDDEAWLNQLFIAIHCEVNRVLRLSDPQYTIEPTSQTPPPPHWSEGIQKLLDWRYLYAKGVTDKELARAGGISYGRFRNLLSQLNLQRTERGRPRKKDPASEDVTN